MNMVDVISVRNRAFALSQRRRVENQKRLQQRQLQRLQQSRGARSRSGLISRNRTLSNLNRQIGRLNTEQTRLTRLSKLPTPEEFRTKFLRDRLARFKSNLKSARRAVDQGISTKFLSGEVFNIVRQFRVGQTQAKILADKKKQLEQQQLQQSKVSQKPKFDLTKFSNQPLNITQQNVSRNRSAFDRIFR